MTDAKGRFSHYYCNTVTAYTWLSSRDVTTCTGCSVHKMMTVMINDCDCDDNFFGGVSCACMTADAVVYLSCLFGRFVCLCDADSVCSVFFFIAQQHHG